MIDDNELNQLQKLAKERTVLTQQTEYDLETLVKKIERGIMKLDPDYQRRNRWKPDTQSRLIESLILNIPIPTIYLSIDIDTDIVNSETEAIYSVIDGQQRLNSIYRFFSNQYKLEDLKLLKILNGLYYKDLPLFLIRRLEERTIKCIRIDSTADPQVKIDIFERLNSGSFVLESQELRNAVFRGPFNTLCKELSTNSNYRKLLQIDLDAPEKSSKVEKMQDVEYVLRFYALKDDKYKDYKKSKTKYESFKVYLDIELDRGNNLTKHNPIELEKFKNEFITVIDMIYNAFGERAFAKFDYEKGKLSEQSRFNASVYDALMVAVYSELYLNNIREITSKQRNNFIELFKSNKFHESVSGSILDSTKINYRIDEARRIFRK